MITASVSIVGGVGFAVAKHCSLSLLYCSGNKSVILHSWIYGRKNGGTAQLRTEMQIILHVICNRRFVTRFFDCRYVKCRSE
jgi:hypothetical protein